MAGCDLHMHSTVSDGTLSVAELVQAVHEAGIEAFALTDHDSVEGWGSASAEAQRLGLRTIPGVEVSTRGKDLEHHILGYGFDPQHAGLLGMFSTLQEQRRLRLPALVERLNELGIPLELSAVEAIAGASNPGRPHVARALVEGGYCSDIQDAFERFLGDGQPANVKKSAPTPGEAIAMLHEAGGVAVWAHPCVKPIRRPGGLGGVVEELVRAGLDGLEVIHPSHGPTQRRNLRRLARQHSLRTTGGSDFHSPTPESAFGRGHPGDEVPIEIFDALAG